MKIANEKRLRIIREILRIKKVKSQTPYSCLLHSVSLSKISPKLYLFDFTVRASSVPVIISNISYQHPPTTFPLYNPIYPTRNNIKTIEITKLYLYTRIT